MSIPWIRLDEGFKYQAARIEAFEKRNLYATRNCSTFTVAPELYLDIGSNFDGSALSIVPPALSRFFTRSFARNLVDTF